LLLISPAQRACFLLLCVCSQEIIATHAFVREHFPLLPEGASTPTSAGSGSSSGSFAGSASASALPPTPQHRHGSSQGGGSGSAGDSKAPTTPHGSISGQYHPVLLDALELE
jgi:hypothetical protein